jgi:hypothetical protein
MQQENLVMGTGWHSRDRGKAKKVYYHHPSCSGNARGSIISLEAYTRMNIYR